MSEEITCPICTKQFKGEANLKRHQAAMHKHSQLMVVSIPNDKFKYNSELGIFEGVPFTFPPNYEFVTALPKRSIRQDVNGNKIMNAACLDVIVRFKE